MPDTPHTTDTEDQDAVEFLLDQHQQVRRLFADLQGPATDDRQETFDTLLRLLAVHETAEEEVIYPALRAYAPNGNEIADARAAEEDEAKKQLSDLEALGTTGEGFDQKLAVFREAVLAHATAEEREVFPLLKAHVDPGQLTAMRTLLVAAEAVAPTHPHPHAPESAIGNLVMGPVVAIFDRVRDAIKAATNRSS